MTTLMPGIDIDTLFIGREDQEGDMAAALQRRMTMTPTWKRGVGARFLGGRPPPTLGERRMTTKMPEMSRDRKHEEDIMMRLMFETLCKGKPLLSLSTARPKRQSLATTAARAGGADPSRTKRSRMGQG